MARRIRRALSEADERFPGVFLAPPVLTKGIDEVSAVLKRPERLFDVIVAINLSLWPLRFRFGAGAGSIDVGLSTRDASKMDGPAFHLAADALRRAEREKHPLAIDFPGVHDTEVRLIEALALAHRVITSDWTESVAKVTTTYRSMGKQVKTAKALKVTQQAVSKDLTRGHNKPLRFLEDSIRGWLEALDDGSARGTTG